MTHTHHRKLHAARARAFAHAATTALPTYPVPPQLSLLFFAEFCGGIGL